MKILEIGLISEIDNVYEFDDRIRASDKNEIWMEDGSVWVRRTGKIGIFQIPLNSIQYIHWDSPPMIAAASPKEETISPPQKMGRKKNKT